MYHDTFYVVRRNDNRRFFDVMSFQSLNGYKDADIRESIIRNNGYDIVFRYDFENLDEQKHRQQSKAVRDCIREFLVDARATGRFNKRYLEQKLGVTSEQDN